MELILGPYNLFVYSLEPTTAMTAFHNQCDNSNEHSGKHGAWGKLV